MAGSSAPGTGPVAIHCPNCGAGVVLRAQGRSLAVVCANCASVLDAADPNYRLLSSVNKQNVFTPAIPLGLRGKFRDVVYEVVGFLVRADKTATYTWSEYLLYNPMQGFHWLVESGGGWSFVKMIKEQPASSAGGVNYNNRTFKPYLVDHPSVIYVLGEFYWRVAVGESVAAIDYIAPPFMLSMESSADETVWSLGEYLPPGAVETAFAPARLTLPYKAGVAAHEPNPYSESLGRLLAIGILFSFAAGIAAMRRPPPYASNAATGAILILAFPGWRFYRRNSFESRRWADSDFNTGDGDE